MGEAPAIRLDRLGKRFRVNQREPGLGAALRALFVREHVEVDAVHELSFEVPHGQRVGLLGPNGAGKTTTLKMLAGLLHPTHGRAEVLGHEPARRSHEFLRSIALVMRRLEPSAIAGALGTAIVLAIAARVTSRPG